MNMNGLYAVTHSLTDSVSDTINNGFDLIGVMANRVVHLIRNLPKEMQKNPTLAVGTFAAANALFFSTLLIVVEKLDGQVENQEKGKQLNNDQRLFKVVWLDGIVVGSSIFTFNFMLARLTRYELSAFALAAMSIAAIASRLLVSFISMRGPLGSLLSKNLPNFFSVNSSPTKWALKTAEDLMKMDHPLMARCVVAVSAGLSLSSAVKNLVCLITKVAVSLFAFTIGQVPAIEERTWTKLENWQLVDANFALTVVMLAYHTYQTVLFATFSPISCLTLGFLSPSLNKQAHEWLKLTGFKQKPHQNDEENEEFTVEEEIADNSLRVASPTTGQLSQKAKAEPISSPIPVESQKKVSEIPVVEIITDDRAKEKSDSEKHDTETFVEGSLVNNETKPPLAIVNQEPLLGPPPPPPPPPPPAFKAKKKVETASEKSLKTEKEEKISKDKESKTPLLAELKRKVQQKEKSQKPIDEELAQRQQKAAADAKAGIGIYNHPMLAKASQMEEKRLSTSEEDIWRLSGSHTKVSFTEEKKTSQPAVVVSAETEKKPSPQNVSKATPLRAVRVRPLPAIPGTPPFVAGLQKEEAKTNITPPVQPQLPKEAAKAEETPAAQTKPKEDEELKQLEAEEAALALKAALLGRRRDVGTVTPSKMKKDEAKKADAALLMVRQKKQQRQTIIGAFTPEDVVNAGK